jgi:hypothetical protein
MATTGCHAALINEPSKTRGRHASSSCGPKPGNECEELMLSGMRTVIYPVMDLAGAKTVYGKLLDWMYCLMWTRLTTTGSESETMSKSGSHGHSQGMTGLSVVTGTLTTSRRLELLR